MDIRLDRVARLDHSISYVFMLYTRITDVPDTETLRCLLGETTEKKWLDNRKRYFNKLVAENIHNNIPCGYIHLLRRFGIRSYSLSYCTVWWWLCDKTNWLLDRTNNSNSTCFMRHTAFHIAVCCCCCWCLSCLLIFGSRSIQLTKKKQQTIEQQKIDEEITEPRHCHFLYQSWYVSICQHVPITNNICVYYNGQWPLDSKTNKNVSSAIEWELFCVHASGWIKYIFVQFVVDVVVGLHCALRNCGYIGIYIMYIWPE